MDGTVRTLRRHCVDVCFAFEADALLNEEGLGKVKQETLCSLLKNGGC